MKKLLLIGIILIALARTTSAMMANRGFVPVLEQKDGSLYPATLRRQQ